MDFNYNIENCNYLKKNQILDLKCEIFKSCPKLLKRFKFFLNIYFIVYLLHLYD